MGVKKAASFGGTCSVCNTAYTTGEQVCMEKAGDKWVICKNEDCFHNQGGTISPPKQQGGRFTSTKMPISKAPEVYAMAEGMLTQFLAKRAEVVGADGFDQEVAQAPEMPINEQAVFIESIFRTLSQNFKDG